MIQFIELCKTLAGKSKPVEKEVAPDTKVLFYPITPGDIFHLKALSSSVADALGLLFTARGQKATARDSETIFRNVKDESEDGNGTVDENIVGAVTVEMAELRTKQTQEAYKQLSELVSDRANMEVLAKIILSSLRAQDKADPMAVAQMLELDLPVFMKFVGGMLDASSGAMGQLGKDIGRVLKEGIAPDLGEAPETEEKKGPTAT